MSQESVTQIHVLCKNQLAKTKLTKQNDKIHLLLIFKSSKSSEIELSMESSIADYFKFSGAIDKFQGR